jgi:hypothetical protein
MYVSWRGYPAAALHYPPFYPQTSWSSNKRGKHRRTKACADPPYIAWPIGLAGKTHVGKTYDAAIPGSRLPYTVIGELKKIA